MSRLELVPLGCNLSFPLNEWQSSCRYFKKKTIDCLNQNAVDRCYISVVLLMHFLNVHDKYIHKFFPGQRTEPHAILLLNLLNGCAPHILENRKIFLEILVHAGLEGPCPAKMQFFYMAGSSQQSFDSRQYGSKKLAL
jgi:hypothetical protein